MFAQLPKYTHAWLKRTAKFDEISISNVMNAENLTKSTEKNIDKDDDDDLNYGNDTHNMNSGDHMGNDRLLSYNDGDDFREKSRSSQDEASEGDDSSSDDDSGAPSHDEQDLENDIKSEASDDESMIDNVRRCFVL